MTGVREARAKFYNAASTLQQDAKQILGDVALMAKLDQLAAARAAGVGERLRGVGRSGAKISVGYTIVGFSNPAAIVAWRGPAHLANNPTAAHEIAPKGRKHKALTVGDGIVARSHSGGTTGKHFFEAGVEATHAKAPATVQHGVHRALAKHFTGG